MQGAALTPLICGLSIVLAALAPPPRQ